MAFLIKDNWEFLNKELWIYLDKSKSTPEDMYIELLRAYYVASGQDVASHVDVLNDNGLAKSTFKRLTVPGSELACIKLLENYYEVLKKFSKSNVAENYKTKLADFFEKHNIRYFVTTDCKISMSLQGLLMSMLLRLRKSISGNQTRIDSLDELEQSLSKLMHSHEEKSCIRISSNLIEGVVVDKAQNKANTLGAALHHCGNLFPHDSLGESLRSLYKFYNDYPNIRHAGNPANCRRVLKKDDALLVTALSLLFSSYISNNDDGRKLLLGDL
jgi:replicative superfamily II helicase